MQTPRPHSHSLKINQTSRRRLLILLSILTILLTLLRESRSRATLRQRSNLTPLRRILSREKRIIGVLGRDARHTRSETLARGIDITRTLEMSWHAQFAGIPERILARWISLREQKVEFILMGGLLFLGCGERGIGLLGEGVLRGEGGRKLGLLLLFRED